MKKYVLFICLLWPFYTLTIAQNIPNPSFDSVYFGGIDRIFSWITSDGIMMSAGGSFGDTVHPLAPNTFHDASFFQYHELLWMGQQVDTTPYSNLAIQLNSHPEKVKTNGEHFESFIINGHHFYTDSSGYADLNRCGVPFSARPATLTGYYKFVDSTLIGMNTGRCLILLKKWNSANHQSDTIAFVDARLPFVPSLSWQPFSIPINYQNSMTPDSIMVAFMANSTPSQPSVFWLDELAFTYSGIGNEEIERPYIEVYPNPFTSVIQIKAIQGTPEYFEMLDAKGQVIKSGHYTESILASDLPAGFLILKLVWPDGNLSFHRLIKR